MHMEKSLKIMNHTVRALPFAVCTSLECLILHSSVLDYWRNLGHFVDVELRACQLCWYLSVATRTVTNNCRTYPPKQTSRNFQKELTLFHDRQSNPLLLCYLSHVTSPALGMNFETICSLNRNLKKRCCSSKAVRNSVQPKQHYFHIGAN